MAKLPFTDALRSEYVRLFTSCVIRPERQGEVEKLVDQLAAHKARYQAVADAMGIPWSFVAVIHNMEASQNFTRHLHNGDPLTARTVHVPAGRPKTHAPPFTWEESAQDALAMRGIGSKTDWGLAGTLYQLETYNGVGYRLYHPDVLTPYLWSYSNHYTSGKYVADGTWSQSAKSAQCGAAVLLRRMAERKLIDFADQPQPAKNAGPLVVGYSVHRPQVPAELAQVINLQNWLSTHPGVFVKPDGVPGPGTSDAYRLVTGHHLPGDPRGD